MFIGRHSDLQFLNSEYHKEAFSFIPIYGRRRVGKTTLIREFMKGKAAIYFQAFEERTELNLERLSAAVNLQIFGPQGQSLPPYQDFGAILESLTQYLNQTDEKIVFVIDEFPYLARVLPEASSLLQYYIDHYWQQAANLQLILCGSSMSFMKKQVLGYQAPLYGRKTGQIQLKSFDFWETQDYFPDTDAETVFTFFALSGGIPQYLAQFDPKLSVSENIASTFFNKNNLLFEEPQNLLKQELEDPTNYNSILRAIAEGASRMNEIATKTQITTGNLSKFLENLIDLDIVEKKYPAGETRSKKSIYRIKDTMFRFWFRFVASNLSQIEIEMIKPLIDQVALQVNDFLGPIFEDLCIHYLYLQMNESKVPLFGNLGSWWGTDPIKKQQVEIDILGKEGDDILLGECKWRNQPTNRATIQKFLEKQQLFRYHSSQRYFFSKSDYTPDARALAEENRVTLIRFEDLF